MENNRLIAEFMGVEPRQISSSLWGLSNTPFWAVTGPTAEKVMQDATSNFKYDSDWNMLMAAGRKSMESALNMEAHEWVTALEEAAGAFNISILYKIVVEFINWYNSQTK